MISMRSVLLGRESNISVFHNGVPVPAYRGDPVIIRCTGTGTLGIPNRISSSTRAWNIASDTNRADGMPGFLVKGILFHTWCIMGFRKSQDLRTGNKTDEELSES